MVDISKRCLATVFFMSLAAFGSEAMAGQLSHKPLKLVKVDDEVYFVEGPGPTGDGNSGIIIGTSGVIVVDLKSTTDLGKAVLAEISKITPKTVTHVILTHSDADHVNGIAAFPLGLTIIAQENNKKEQETALAARESSAPPADRLPTLIIKNNEVLSIDGVKVELLHWAPAHTSGDMVIYLPEHRIAFTGDITPSKTGLASKYPDPSLHLGKNGSAMGWLESERGIVSLEADQFIPGHGDIQTKADIVVQLRSGEDKCGKVGAMIKDGKSWDVIKARMGDSRSRQDRPTFTEICYRELVKK